MLEKAVSDMIYVSKTAGTPQHMDGGTVGREGHGRKGVWLSLGMEAKAQKHKRTGNIQ